MITTIVYTLVFVLAFPTLADAECAWVLWQHTITVTSAAKAGDEWVPVGAHNDREACVRTLALPDFDSKHVTRGPITVETVFACLSDTVDPRGPKGAGP